MNLYLVTRISEPKWDNFRGFVCAAKTPEQAQHMNPRSGEQYDFNNTLPSYYKEWVSSPDDVTVKFLGRAVKGLQGVILTDYKAG